MFPADELRTRQIGCLCAALKFVNRSFKEGGQRLKFVFYGGHRGLSGGLFCLTSRMFLSHCPSVCWDRRQKDLQGFRTNRLPANTHTDTDVHKTTNTHNLFYWCGCHFLSAKPSDSRGERDRWKRETDSDKHRRGGRDGESDGEKARIDRRLTDGQMLKKETRGRCFSRILSP